jgi:hypothetical protein
MSNEKSDICDAACRPKTNLEANVVVVPAVAARAYLVVVHGWIGALAYGLAA